MIVTEYNNEWPLSFLKIKNELENNLSSFIRIEHVGSTAIKGICAKPIIDLVIIVKNDNEYFQIKKDLEIKFGYFHIGDGGLPSREVFKRKNSLNKMCSLEQNLLENDIFKHNGNVNSEVLDTIKHNLYVCKNDSKILYGLILFRDYLNNNYEEMQRYYKLKMEIIEKHGNENYDKYVKIKNDEYGWFFMEILNKALIIDKNKEK